MRSPFRYAAWLELIQAAARFELMKPGGGASFIAEVARLHDLLSTQPAMGERLDAEFREFPLRGFHYSLVYRVEEGVVISAIVDSRRRPDYWRKNTAWLREPSILYIAA